MMEKKEIIRRNEAIANYMGDPRQWFGGQYKSEDMEFDEDWSHLMPVVEKIMIDSGVNLACERDDDGLYIALFIPGHYGSYFPHSKSVGDSMIESVWMGVSDYCLDMQDPTMGGKWGIPPEKNQQ